MHAMPRLVMVAALGAPALRCLRTALPRTLLQQPLGAAGLQRYCSAQQRHVVAAAAEADAPAGEALPAVFC